MSNARKLERLTRQHDAYRWICGGMQVNYHTLSDFRSQSGEVLDGLLTENVASLMAAGVVKLKSVAQDGMRVRASAGAASFRREEKLKGYLEAARAQVEALKQRQGKKAENARTSTTDADATVMKMDDGGFRAAYNIEFGSDTASQIIVGVDVVTTGSDMAPMVEQVVKRCGTAPEHWLVDGGFPAHAQIDAVAKQTRVIAPVPKPKATSQDKKNQQDDPPSAPAVAAARPLRRRAAHRCQRPRPPTRISASVATARRWGIGGSGWASTRSRRCTRNGRLLPNASMRRHATETSLCSVRGLKKVKAVAYLYALAHNLMRMISLAPEMLGIGTGTPEICPDGGINVENDSKSG